MISFWNYSLKKRGYLNAQKSHQIRTLMDSQHFKRSETLLKSTREKFPDIFWSLSKKITFKISFLEVFEILRLFVNILTPENKYTL